MLRFKNPFKSQPTEHWLIPDRLLSLYDDTVRVEIGPQVVTLPVTDENLSDTVTHPHYRLGARDAMGRLIVMGERMQCVDYKARIKPHMWKVYRLQSTEEGDVVSHRFIKVAERESFDEAVTFARNLGAQ